MTGTGGTYATSTPRARLLVGLVLVAALLTGGVGFSAAPGHAAAPGAGSLDTSFNPGAGANGPVRSVALDSDGRVVIAGDFTEFNGVGRTRIARLNADGTLDETFDPGTGANGTVFAVALQPDGRVLIAGDFTEFNGVGRDRIARLNTNGTLDTTFGPGADLTVRSIAVQPDGKILIGGIFSNVDAPGSVLRLRIARFDADGTLDETFNPGAGANGMVQSIALQPDGRILIGGEFTLYNNVGRNRIARLNADGTLDTGFAPGSAANGIVRSVAVQPDDEILIGGSFTTYRNVDRNGIARVDRDGPLDGTFNPGTGANFPVESVVSLSDGKVLIGGDFTTYAGESINRIARLDDDGSLDEAFDPGTGANNLIRSIAVDADGRVLIAGDFTEFNGVQRNGIARLNSDPPPPTPTTTTSTTSTTVAPTSTTVAPTTTVVPGPSSVVLQLTLDFGVGDNVRAGTSTVTGSGRGLAAFADVLLVLRSDPEMIGAAVTNGSGDAEVVGAIPGGTPAGRHSVTIESVAPDGSVVTDTAFFWLDANGTVTAVTPDGPTAPAGVVPRFTG